MHPVVRELPLVAVLVALWAGTAWAWGLTPDRMPVHWNLYGEVDGWGGRAEGLLIAPGIATGVTVLLAVLPRITPDGHRLQEAAGRWAALRLALVSFFAVVHALIVAAALGSSVHTTTWITGAAGLLFAAIGATLPGIGPNWVAGIRTPWTLSSRRSWDETHRVGGYAFVAVGLTTALVAPFAGWVALPILLGGLLAATALATVVSYRVWRDDPDRR